MNDCYQAYYWILTQARQQLGMEIEKVVVIGDSAGGHLACAVTQLCILRKFRVPDGLIMVYPECCSNLNHFFPSNLLAIDDFLLSADLLQFCAKEFLSKGGNPTKNVVLSPVYMPLSLSARFPVTRILVCEADPLRDMGVYLANHLNQAQVDVRLLILQEYVHGFLNFDSITFGIPEYHAGSRLITQLLKELL